LKKIKKQVRRINRIAAQKGKDYQARLADAYRQLLRLARLVAARTQELLDAADSAGWGSSGCYLDLIYFLAATEHVCGTAQRRVLQGEQVPIDQKLLSLFEPYTQLIKRGKAGQPVQFGHSVLVLEDAVGFVCHYRLLNRGEDERGIVVGQLQTLQSRLEGRIQRASFDRGFHSPENQLALAQIVAYPCLPKPGAQQAQQQQSQATLEFRQSRQRHPGVESAIGALQSGNGLKRCRDRTRAGFARYVGLGILGRNLHVLGKLVITRQDAACLAAFSLRQPAAA
jgi:transposase, IS5 family